MAVVFEVDNLRNGYIDLVREVQHQGERVSPRGLPTVEVPDATIVVHDWFDTLPVGIGRGVSLKFAAVEALQLIGEFVDVDLMLAANPNMEQFTNKRANGAKYFHGGYGMRVVQQAARVTERLKLDPDSRQAVAVIWRPDLDLMRMGADDGEPIRDLPCTIGMQFRIRDDKLDVSVVMRSNDVWWGVAYDVFCFTQYAATIAHRLGIEPGRYAHHAFSLHMYERDFDKVSALQKTNAPAPLVHVRGIDGGDPVIRAESIRCGVQRTWTASESWYVGQIAEVCKS